MRDRTKWQVLVWAGYVLGVVGQLATGSTVPTLVMLAWVTGMSVGAFLALRNA